MSREDIIRMAEEAGFGQCTKMLPLKWMGYDEAALTKFAQLVAATEREECAKLCDGMAQVQWGTEAAEAAEMLAYDIRARNK